MSYPIPMLVGGKLAFRLATPEEVLDHAKVVQQIRERESDNMSDYVEPKNDDDEWDD